MATADCREFIDPGALELLAFIGDDEGAQRAAFRQSDLDFVRVLDDLIYLLMDKGFFSFVDLPDAAQKKLLDRQSLRQRHNSLGLMSDSDEGVI